MGKKRIIAKEGGGVNKELRSRALSKLPKKKIANGILNIQVTYNNTKMALSDSEGNIVVWSSSGALGFKGAKKGTPYAASRVAGLVAEKATAIGLNHVDINIKGVGSGRESSIRTFITSGIDVGTIRDLTPIPHNGPRPRKPKRN